MASLYGVRDHVRCISCHVLNGSHLAYDSVLRLPLRSDQISCPAVSLSLTRRTHAGSSSGSGKSNTYLGTIGTAGLSKNTSTKMTSRYLPGISGSIVTTGSMGEGLLYTNTSTLVPSLYLPGKPDSIGKIGEDLLYTNLSTKVPSPCLPAISSHSLGRVFAGHDLNTKLHAAASHNIRGIELAYEDLHALASLLPGGPTNSNLITAAHEVRNLTDFLSLSIIALQPFHHYEGLISRTAHAAKIEKAKLWFRLAKILGTNVILIPSSFLPASECTSNFTTIVRDMIVLADLGEQEHPPIRFAYENICWGTHINTWEAVHAVVSEVDRWNFGYCWDTFNIAGGVYGDPSSADGKTNNGEVALMESLRRMVDCVDREKIFFIQVVDAERVSPPITPKHQWYDASQPARMSWSRNARLFPFEEERGGYLPVVDVCRALFEGLGYRGWVSFELFSRTLAETGAEVPEEHAARTEKSWRKLIETFPEILGESTTNGRIAVRTESFLSATFV